MCRFNSVIGLSIEVVFTLNKSFDAAPCSNVPSTCLNIKLTPELRFTKHVNTRLHHVAIHIEMQFLYDVRLTVIWYETIKCFISTVKEYHEY